MEQYTTQEFESFMMAMKKISDILHSEKPNFIFAPLIGSVPLIDILAVIDRHFPLENVEYPPNSSRFLNREEIMDKWYSNFLHANYIGEPLSVISVDEVISGSSVVKGYREFRKVLHGMTHEKKNRLEKIIDYKIFAVGEEPNGKKRNHGFIKLVNQGKAKVFETPRIITADNRDLNPIRLKIGEKNRQGRQTYLPDIDSLTYSESYLNLLHDVAAYCGVDPEKVTPVNILKMQRSLEKYLK